ncbi:DNA-binding response regulator [Salinivibrio sp. MA351]|uniref:LytR/AlgR family response regulator transcription factor n=1 Tax=Salinivibrio sp. MA351 TaxID=1909453 RepID=UPI0009894158|nr:LytTR family DNA-binding domain-containing protein [Salinivibrio sp. MA351]OOE97355.1 DNA-binding response regulator [Salinivibrio sp. MA351]
MLRAVIVEDEYLAQEELRYLVEKHSDLEIIESFDDGLAALKYLQTHPVDVLFLDINIPSIEGMLLARSLHADARPPFVIFTTAYKEHAADAFELEAFDYLLKPLNETRVKGVLNKLALAAAPTDTLTEQRHTLHLMRDNRIRITDTADILYAAANEKTTLVYTPDGEFYVPYTISELMTQLPANFFRCHRSYCINLDKITEIEPGLNSTYHVFLPGISDPVLVSRGNLKAFRERMQL